MFVTLTDRATLSSYDPLPQRTPTMLAPKHLIAVLFCALEAIWKVQAAAL